MKKNVGEYNGKHGCCPEAQQNLSNFFAGKEIPLKMISEKLRQCSGGGMPHLDEIRFPAAGRREEAWRKISFRSQD